MSKIMNTIAMSELMGRIIGEWSSRASIYDIPGELTKRVLEFEKGSPGFSVNGYNISLPVGPAAGPHTQIAPNLIAAWMAGARVFELKTVQENDRLDIDKPCIDALDEGHNVEWSTELLLDEARAEYLRAWIAIHILRAALCEKPGNIMFNMSVGYTLDGIKGPRMDAFIEGMRSPSATKEWEAALKEAKAALDGPAFASAFGKEGTARAIEALRNISPRPIHSVTISTMHGCPPEEIERIGAYLIEDKGFDTYVKLNPTLLGYDKARAILDNTGWERIVVTRPTFENDLQFDSALSLISSLSQKAKAKGRSFGLKLSNTLANVNDEKRMPGGERYMSGRALFPLTSRLAAMLAEAIPEPPAFSFCAGVSAHNAYDCLKAGLGPLTLATDILKPGGYMRFEPIAREAVRAIKDGLPARPDKGRLSSLADEASQNKVYRGDYKQGEVKINKLLPLTDCFAAPCVEACPALQQPPSYMKAQADGEAEKALSIVLADNPLPFITGVLCDHQCMYACSRLDYEGSVEIRDMKLHCARNAEIPVVKKPGIENKGRTAVFGAGPAGLACAHYLALGGYPVTVFDKAKTAGGVVAHIIPQFRIKREELEADINRIKALGAEFSFGHSGKIDIEKLKAEGYTSIVIASGAPVPRMLELEGTGIKVVDALEFLEAYNNKSDEYDSYKNIAIVGGGNTAMDASRVAVRLGAKPAVSILYRRSLKEMPADREEYRAAMDDGVKFKELALPEAIVGAGERPSIRVRKMTLGEPDSSGRRSPVASEDSWEEPCDLIVSAVGESPDAGLFQSLGIKLGQNGRPIVEPETMATNIPHVYATGDARRGPFSIIAAERDGRLAAYSILRNAGIEPNIDKIVPAEPDYHALSKRGEILTSLDFDDPDFIKREAERCLACDSACLRCVEVCPNRANVALPIMADSSMTQSIQIVHVDELCNECGNCGFFCPYDGEPYRHKPTLFRDEEALKQSKNPGFAFVGNAGNPSLVLRMNYGSGSPVQTLKITEWTKLAQEDGKAAAMPKIAKTIFDKHKYMIKGGLV